MLRFLLIALLAVPLTTDQHPWGSDGQGRYHNPVLPMDISDLDAIRVGSDYYAISSTIQFSPGMVVLHSKDLVNWEFVGHVVPDISKLDPNLNWDKMNGYGKGVWAGSIRFHDGRFWVYFNVPSSGFFMSTAQNPAGPWTPVHNLRNVTGWDDPCPFWDDDGQGYLVATNFDDDYKIHLFQLTADGRGLTPGFDRVIHQSEGSEANKLYKFKGLYYHLFSDVKAEGRVVEMGRASSLDGPWEMRQLIHVNPKVDKEPNQGGLMDDGAGHWYFFSHQGTGDWEGRAAVLLPVTWVDGWPVIGKVGPDGIGEMVWSGPMPIQGSGRTSRVASDRFEGAFLRPEWEWNHQPRADRWSLTERPGALRLHAFAPVRSRELQSVGNVLTQRSMRSDANQVTAKLDLVGMREGDRAGLVHFAQSACALAIHQARGEKAVMYDCAGPAVEGQRLTGPAVWLRSTWSYQGISQFSYSADGTIFQDFGRPYQLTWGNYRGDRVGLFTYSEKREGGYVDVNSFTYMVSKSDLH